ncbi:Gamma-tubulin complex component 6, partial [Stegodyphus mimosarum]
MIMKFVINDLRLDSLLMNLRNVYFFQDEGFSQTLCEQLFSLVLGCKSPLEFANWTVLNEIISNAIGDSCCSNESTLPSLSVKAASVPEDSLWEWNDFLRLFCIEFKVEWPLNIIIHRACIAQYGNIFSKLLEMEFLCWLLGRIWRSCLTDERALLLQDSPQYKE